MNKVGQIVVASVMLAVSACSVIGADKQPLKPQRDLACGPRAVQGILAHYGHKEDLISLIRETQWPQFEEGASLASLALALQSRGVFTCCVQVEPNSIIKWPHPAIVHISDQGVLGHYVVAWSDKVETEGTSSLNQGTFVKRLARPCSGAVLLTARKPILKGDVETAFDVSVGAWRFFVMSSVVAVCAVLAFVGLRSFKSMILKHLKP